MKTKVKTMGFFRGFGRPIPKVKPRFCSHCGRPVSETVGNSGICKKCIEEAKRIHV